MRKTISSYSELKTLIKQLQHFSKSITGVQPILDKLDKLNLELEEGESNLVDSEHFGEIRRDLQRLLAQVKIEKWDSKTYLKNIAFRLFSLTGAVPPTDDPVFSDVIYQLLLVLAKINPINDKDILTFSAIEEIKQNDRIYVSSGHVYHLYPLINYLNKRKESSLPYLNLYINEPFSDMDIIHIGSIAKGKRIETHFYETELDRAVQIMGTAIKFLAPVDIDKLTKEIFPLNEALVRVGQEFNLDERQLQGWQRWIGDFDERHFTAMRYLMEGRDRTPAQAFDDILGLSPEAFEQILQSATQKQIPTL